MSFGTPSNLIQGSFSSGFARRNSKVLPRTSKKLPSYNAFSDSSSLSDDTEEEESKEHFCLHCRSVKIDPSWRKQKYCSANCRKAANRKVANRKVAKAKSRPTHLTSVKENYHPAAPVNTLMKKIKQDEEVSSSHWVNYLVKSDFIAAPVSCFKHVALFDSWNDITKGFKVEVENMAWLKYKDHLSKFYWVASVQKVAGYMALLRYEGFESDNSRDFWVHMCTTELHRLGWCVSEKHLMVPPEEVEQKYIDAAKQSPKSPTKARTLPQNFALKVRESLTSRFVVGTKVEVVDKDRISCVRVAKVSKVIGGRLHLKYAGCEDETGFWCHERSPLIHPIGWAQIMNHHLLATEVYARESLVKALRLDGACIEGNEASWDMFMPVSNPSTNLEFQVGMKLEAIDPLNLSTICVATVTKVLRNNYLMIGIDGMMAADESDCFCYHASSPCIFPVGFCTTNDIQLTPPQGYEGEFKWKEYLKRKKARAAPVGLFKKKIPDHGFKEGMYLEAVDLMEPRLICIASVTNVVGRLLRIHFDGWEENYDQWCDCESPDLYPVGWCQLVGYQLEPPRSTAAEDMAKKKKKTFYKGNRRRKRRTKGEIAELEKSADPVNGKSTSQQVMSDTFANVISSPAKRVGDDSAPGPEPSKWTADDVTNYLRSHECGDFAEILRRENVDGPQFLKLSKESLLGFNGMKVGPSVKIAHLIQQLTQKSVCRKFT